MGPRWLGGPYECEHDFAWCTREWIGPGRHCRGREGAAIVLEGTAGWVSPLPVSFVFLSLAADYDTNTRFNELTRLLNKIWPGSISQLDPCEDGVLRRSNVTKFLDACSAKGLPSEDLFHPDDLMEGTSHGLTRVAGTIIALVKWAETSVPTFSHSLPDGDTVNPESPPLRKRPRIKTGAVDPLHVQPLTGPTRVAVGELSSLSTRFSLPGAHRRLINLIPH